jgi:prepilin-type N-terminal cleavage/methylation domain-containing protein
MKKRRRGFTLIELLVVVGIIAVLIAILLPTLGKAKDNAKKTKCLANLSALTKGAVAYSSDWDNWMPPQRGQGTNGYQPPMTYQMNNGSTLYGFALLYKTKAITDPRVYYCPSQTNPSFMIDPKVERGGDQWYKLDKSSDGGRMGYHYQLHTIGTDSSKREVAYPKHAKYARGAILAVDIIWGAAYVAHGDVNKPSTTYFNASYSDGHAETIRSPDALASLGSDWVKMSKCVDFLERTAGN